MASRSCGDRRLVGWAVCAALTAAALATSLRAQPAPPAGAQAPERVAAQAKRATERLAALQREADTLSRTHQTLLVTLRQLDVERAIAEAKADQADAAARVAAADLARADATVADLDTKMAAMAPVVRATVRRLYVNGVADRAAWSISPAQDAADAARALRLLGALAARDRAVLTEYEATRARLAREREARQARAAEAEAAADAAAQARAIAVTAAETQAARVRAIDQQRTLATQLATELRQATEQLETEVTRLGGASTTTAASMALPIKPFKSTLPWPAEAPVVRNFGPETSSRFGTRVVRQGIELDTAPGTPVTAVHDGRIVFAGPFAGFGQLVIVDHGGAAFTLYGYLDDLRVEKGAMVDRGETLAVSGRSPSGRQATYFELRIDGRPVNPLEWLVRR